MRNMLDTIGFVSQTDPEIGAALAKELMRQRRNIELIASENIVSSSVMAAMATVPTNKYAEGYPGHRYYGGCEYVDEIEQLAIDRVKKLFGAEHANVQPPSGAQANMAVYHALLTPGDTVMGMSLEDGGHLTHGAPVNFSGKLYHFVPYGINQETGKLEIEELRKMAKECRPKMIVAGASAYPRAIDFKAISEVAKEVGAYLFVDMAHIAGLVAAGEHLSPVPYADVVTTTTHKTLRGPRGGVILCKEEFAKKIDHAVFPGIQGGPLEHIIAAKAVCFGEALTEDFKEYQRQVVRNSKCLAEQLIAKGFDLVTGGTDNHMMLVDLRRFGVTGIEMQHDCDEAYITLNKNAIPHDPQSPNVTSGVRIGTPAVTTRGFREEEMKTVADYLYRIATDFAGEKDKVREEVQALCARFPIYGE